MYAGDNDYDRGSKSYYAVRVKGDTPVLIAYHPEYCRPTFAGGTKVASTRAAGTPVSICDVYVHVCIILCA